VRSRRLQANDNAVSLCSARSKRSMPPLPDHRIVSRLPGPDHSVEKTKEDTTTPPVAFVLSGGGARAAVQVGILRALIEGGIKPDMVVGASAGAVNGAWYALYPDRIDALEEVWLGLTKRGVFPGTPAHFAYNFIRHGHAHTINSWTRIVTRHFGQRRFEDAVVPLAALTVRLSDGEVEVWDRGPIVPVLAASTAVPGVFPPQMLNGKLHVDGAVVEFLPIPTAMRRGAGIIYALDCSAYPDDDGTRGMAMDRAAQIAATAWVRLVTERARAAGVVVHPFRPALGFLNDGRDFRQTTRLIDAGYDCAQRVLRAAAKE
jgi:NTE family protein